MKMKTDVEMIKNDKEWYPKRFGIISRDEVKHIEEAYEINGRNEVSLRNLRNTIVMFDSLNGNPCIKDIDKVSAITHVIDCRLVAMGCEV